MMYISLANIKETPVSVIVISIVYLTRYEVILNSYDEMLLKFSTAIIVNYKYASDKTLLTRSLA